MAKKQLNLFRDKSAFVRYKDDAPMDVSGDKDIRHTTYGAAKWMRLPLFGWRGGLTIQARGAPCASHCRWIQPMSEKFVVLFMVKFLHSHWTVFPTMRGSQWVHVPLMSQVS